MESQLIKLTWEEQKVKLKQKFSELQDQDFKFDMGKKGLMYTKLQAKLGMSRDELHKMIASL